MGHTLVTLNECFFVKQISKWRSEKSKQQKSTKCKQRSKQRSKQKCKQNVNKGVNKM